MQKIIIIALLLTSCIKDPQKSSVEFSSPETRRNEELRRQEEERRLALQRQIQFEEAKKEAWDNIIHFAKNSFKEIQPLFSKSVLTVTIPRGVCLSMAGYSQESIQ